MVRFIAIRVLQAAAALLVVVTIVFVLARISGDPVELMAPPQANEADLDRIRDAMGLDRSLLSQYVSFLNDLVHGDLGDSTSYRRPVIELIQTGVPNTLKLGLAAFAFAAAVGVPTGYLAGMRPRGLLDGAVRIVTLIGQSVPSFWLGILLVFVFAVKVQWFPALGAEGWKSVVLPAIALGAYPMAAIARLTRSAVIDVAGRDQTLFLRAKGVSHATLAKHIVRNASLPVVTLSGVQLGAILSGTIVIETLFAWPGVGQIAIQAIQSRDYAVVQGVVIVNTAILSVLLLLVDLSYGWLDPRVRRSHAS